MVCSVFVIRFHIEDKIFFLDCLVIYALADLQLDVKGCRDVYSSFDKYVEVERLEGDNKYHAENHGLQVTQYPALCFHLKIET